MEFEMLDTEPAGKTIIKVVGVGGAGGNAVQHMIRRGVQGVYKIITALLNGSERMSREIAFGMTFELEYEKTKNFEQSVQKAVQTTQELLGRYDSAQRPRSWRGPIGKTVGQFKMYAAFMSSWFLRNGYTAIKISTPLAERAAAAQKLTGVILMGALFHGLAGSPLYSVICNLVDAFDWLFGDEKEMRARKARNPLTAYDSDLRLRIEILPKYFGETNEHHQKNKNPGLHNVVVSFSRSIIVRRLSFRTMCMNVTTLTQMEQK